MFSFVVVNMEDPDHISPTDFSLFLRDIQTNTDVVGFKFQVISTDKMPLDHFKNIYSFNSAENLIFHMAAVTISALMGKVVCSWKTKRL